MIILGIDPGLADVGWGIIEKKQQKSLYIAHGVIKTKADELFDSRLLHIHTEITTIINQYRPAVAALETLYFSKNSTSALPVAHARGVIILALKQADVTISSYAPNTIKQAVTGNGKASKETVQKMMQLLLGLQEIPKPNHAADALAMALCVQHGALVNRLF